MGDWSSYSLSDFLLFSPRVYERLIATYNTELWPLQVLSVAIAGAIFLALTRARGPTALRAAYLLIAVAWAVVGYAYLWETYRTINWAAAYVAPVFVVETALLIALAARPDIRWASRRSLPEICALALLAFAVFGYPAIAMLAGRSVDAAEVFGLMPDPTAIATLALIALDRGLLRWVAAIIPLGWCAVSALTLGALDWPDYWVPPTAAIVALILALAAGRFGGASEAERPDPGRR